MCLIYVSTEGVCVCGGGELFVCIFKECVTSFELLLVN